MTLKPGQEENFPVSFKIPVDMPISKGRTNYYLQTGLDIQSAIDPTDRDAITVVPNKYLKMFFEAVQNLGFREQHRTGDFNGRYQEFEYKPTSFMSRELDEIEVYPRATGNELVIAMQIDKKNKGLFGGLLDDLDLDERYVHFTIPYSQMQDTAQVAGMVKGIIEREYRKI